MFGQTPLSPESIYLSGSFHFSVSHFPHPFKICFQADAYHNLYLVLNFLRARKAIKTHLPVLDVQWLQGCHTVAGTCPMRCSVCWTASARISWLNRMAWGDIYTHTRGLLLREQSWWDPNSTDKEVRAASCKLGKGCRWAGRAGECELNDENRQARRDVFMLMGEEVSGTKVVGFCVWGPLEPKGFGPVFTDLES